MRNLHKKIWDYFQIAAKFATSKKDKKKLYSWCCWYQNRRCNGKIFKFIFL